MFNRFSPASKRVLRAAEQACRNHNHYYVGVGHVLLALIEERDPAVEAWFAERGTAVAEALADVRRALGTGDERTWEGILVTPRVRRVVALAEEAVAPGEAVEPVGLLEALSREGGLAADVIARHTGRRAFEPSRWAAG